MLIKIRYRDLSPTPWRWEIFDDEQHKLVTSSRPFASQREAYADGQARLAEMVDVKPERPHAE
jgi:hypothetical protein